MMGSNKRCEKTTNGDGRRGTSHILTNMLAVRHHIKAKQKDRIRFPQYVGNQKTKTK